MNKTLLIILLFLPIIAIAQPNEVTLVVTGEGRTREEAINQALKSAVEQAFGAFVSSNTEILNDEVIRDEIATISSGNIQKYSEIACVEFPNGRTSISIRATVSIGRLISYTHNHGHKAELAGNVFAANLRMQELRKKNVAEALNNTSHMLYELSTRMYDYSISVSNPKRNQDGTATVIATVKVLSNNNTRGFGEVVSSTFDAIGLSYEEVVPLINDGFEAFGYYFINNTKPNRTSRDINSALGDISGPFLKKAKFFVDNPLDFNQYNTICLRAVMGFSIVDNLGNKYIITADELGHSYEMPLPVSYMNKDHIHCWVTTNNSSYNHSGNPFVKTLVQGLYASGRGGGEYNKGHKVKEGIYFSGVLYNNTDYEAGAVLYEIGPFPITIPLSRLDSISAIHVVPSSNDSYRKVETKSNNE